MKPYTIGWWLEIFQRVIGRQVAYYQLKNEKDYDRYAQLTDWVEQRIIEKYGER